MSTSIKNGKNVTVHNKSSSQKLTVLMPVFNTKRIWLDKAIESVLSQTYKDFTFLIIDDGSQRNTAEYLDTLVQKDNRITVLHNEANMGLIATLNKGIAYANTTWIARMDSDDWCYPDRFEHQMSFLDNHNELAVLGTEAIYLETGKPVPKKISPHTHAEIIANLPFSCSFTHPTTILNREKILSIGGYPNVEYAEDYALWIKIMFETDFQMHILKNVCLKYRRGNPRQEYKNKQSKNTKIISEQIAKYLNTEPPITWKYSTKDTKEITIEELQKSIKKLEIIKDNIKRKFPNCDELFLEYSFNREIKNIYKMLLSKNFSYIFKYLGLEIEYLQSVIKIKNKL